MSPSRDSVARPRPGLSTAGTSLAPAIQAVNGVIVVVARLPTRRKPALPDAKVTTLESAVVIRLIHAASSRLGLNWTMNGACPPVQRVRIARPAGSIESPLRTGGNTDGKLVASPGRVTSAPAITVKSPSGSPNSSPFVKPSPSESAVARAAVQKGMLLLPVMDCTARPKGLRGPPPPGLKWQVEQV